MKNNATLSEKVNDTLNSYIIDEISTASFFNEEMIKKIKQIIPYTPIYLIRPILDYWGESRSKTELAERLVTQDDQQIHQSGN